MPPWLQGGGGGILGSIKSALGYGGPSNEQHKTTNTSGGQVNLLEAGGLLLQTLEPTARRHELQGRRSSPTRRAYFS